MPVPDAGCAAHAAAGHARRDYAGALGRDDPRDPPHLEVISVMAWYGIKITSHRSRIVCPVGLARASLVPEREGWPGEAEGLKISLAGAEDKLAQADRRSSSGTDLGILVVRTTN